MTTMTVDTVERIYLGYRVREQFKAFHKRKKRWACLVVHRRGGKTVACVMDLIDRALRCKKPDGRFAYMSPTYAQSKDTAWEYLKRFTADIPGTEQRESDLMVRFANGARVRLYGAENYDRLRGTYADGVVLDEYGDIDPRAWPEVIRPSLADRHGWAVFIGTPKGRNDFWRIHSAAQDDPQWYSLILRASQSGLLPQHELDDMRRMLTADAYDQELECSFDAAIRGAIYRSELAEMDTAGRVCGVPYDPAVPVWTGWDLGVGDATSIVCAQLVGREVHVIDYYEATGEPLTHYVAWLDSKPYRYSTDLLPHDAGARELGTGKTREELLRQNGRKVRVLPRQDIDDGINAVKLLLPRCWMDKAKTERLRECLAHYHRDFNDRMGVFKDAPVHDWSSHCFTGETKILTRHATCRIMDLPETGEVLTPCGWSAYRNPRITRRNAPLVEVVFSGGYSVRCTPDHSFLTVNGWTFASSLRMGMQIQSTSTLSRSISMVASTVCGLVKGISRAVAVSCTETLGLLHSALFPRDVIFTTGTITRSTTIFATSSAFQRRFISPIHGEMGLEPLVRQVSTSPTQPGKEPLSGIGLRQDVCGTAGTPKAAPVGRNGNESLGPVTTAANRSMRWFARMLTPICSALPSVRRPRIERVEVLTETADVWCLTVPDAECFSLANGAVVHNCADAVRTLAMGLREAQPAKVDIVTGQLPQRRWVEPRGLESSWMGL